MFIADHYAIRTLTTMAEVRQFWGDDPQPDEDNWMLGSTSGVHGSYTTLDHIAACFGGTCDCDPEALAEDAEQSHDRPTFTVLIVQPRLVKMIYGDVPVTRADLPYLRLIIRRSLTAIMASQDGNEGQEAELGAR
jgi:hypothetical protein